MGPFGEGNPEPTFLSRGVSVAERRVIGNDGQHLRLKLRADARPSGRDQHGGSAVTWPAIAFGLGEAGIEEGSRLDVVYSLASDRHGADLALELRVKDVAPTSSEDTDPRT
jgi:single-stranded-DNA-specific exonuclease